ncbi:3-mercaptopyruvate sulfurtransferase [Gracilaria domingensis]|nr:3-mercaptopyruvate sulfurtransferase [Gracilaria domingensis]
MSSSSNRSALVDPTWLASRLQDTTVLDASWYMPAQKHDAYGDYKKRRIPGARFFDIDGSGLCDTSSSLPHMLPHSTEFAAKVSELGVTNEKSVVIYAQSGFVGAARAWWMFRLHGKQDSYLLNGGLNEWESQHLPLETSPPPEHTTTESSSSFVSDVNADLVRDMQYMLRQISDRNGVIIDARSKARFDGTGPEPRPGLLRGHMPGAYNVPSSTVVSAGKMKTADELRQVFKEAGLHLDTITQPVSLTCGSGVTAAILCAALHELGVASAVYDGSWSEYGAINSNPVTT